MPSDVTAARAADIILRGFQDFHQRFRAITRRAVERFEARDWDGIRRDTVLRLNLHAPSVAETLKALRKEFGEAIDEKRFWNDAREAYSLTILGADESELSQTYFNSLTRALFSHEGVDPAIDFLSRDFPLPYRGWELASARIYVTRAIDASVARRILEDARLRAPWQDLEGDAARAAEAIRVAVLKAFGSEEVDALEFLRPVMIRNKAAYLIGRARRRGKHLPLVLPILNPDPGLVLDGVVHNENDISIVFSFARWYFHADLPSPRQAIGFLHSILPRKRVSELYISLGYNPHGKTEFYSDLTSTIAYTKERFIVAPGVPGLVMSVFTLPSYEFVFKVIRDRFPASKSTTPRKIRRRYREVLMHDRVGRLVDFQEFEHLQFPRRLFTPKLLNELLATASKNVRIDGDKLTIRHLYVGRRVTPLDLFLDEAEPAACERAVIDWGHAVKELAAANVFAGDMLLKNFGVTRHGRVVFYDYDELCELTDCRFREFPEPRDDMQALESEPWFTVADGDVFPSELGTFLELRGHLREIFEEHHGDIFRVDFWRTVQQRNRDGEVIDFYPYADSLQQRQPVPEG